jgi:predicted DNA-binding protein
MTHQDLKEHKSVTLRMPQELIDRIKNSAGFSGRTVSREIVYRMKHSLDRFDQLEVKTECVITERMPSKECQAKFKRMGTR